MKRVHILGRKNHGKTTLMVELVGHLTSSGYRVGTIKHTHHEHELDTPGKDSHRHRQAGAWASAILSPGLNALFWTTPPRKPGEPAAYDQFAPHFASCDLVLVEGDTSAAAPKIEVWRAGMGSSPIAMADPAIAAVVTDDDLRVIMPVWPRSDIQRIARGVLAFVGCKRAIEKS